MKLKFSALPETSALHELGEHSTFNIQRSTSKGSKVRPRTIPHRRRRMSERGITLIECLAYIALMAIFLNLATGAWFRALENSNRLRRNSEDIARALWAGERWREDVRQASQLPMVDGILRLTKSGGTVDYYFAQNAIWRRDSATGRSIPVLRDVADSRMERDARPRVTGWRWELELRTQAKKPSVKPLFTFEAAPAANSAAP